MRFPPILLSPYLPIPLSTSSSYSFHPFYISSRPRPRRRRRGEVGPALSSVVIIIYSVDLSIRRCVPPLPTPTTYCTPWPALSQSSRRRYFHLHGTVFPDFSPLFIFFSITFSPHKPELLPSPCRLQTRCVAYLPSRTPAAAASPLNVNIYHPQGDYKSLVRFFLAE